MDRVKSSGMYVSRANSMFYLLALCFLFTACTQSSSFTDTISTSTITTEITFGTTKFPETEVIKAVRWDIANSWYEYTEEYNEIADELYRVRQEDGEALVIFEAEYANELQNIEKKGCMLSKKTGIVFDSFYSSPNLGEGYETPRNACVFRYKVSCIINGEPAVYCWLDLVRSSNWEMYDYVFGQTAVGHDLYYFPLNNEWAILMNYAY